jgi:hypothetical protein
MNTTYARGDKAWGICARSGRRMLLKDMVFDGQYPNMRVDPAWYEPKHPLERVVNRKDPIALWRPAPEPLQQPTPPVLSGDVQAGPAIELSWTESRSRMSQVDTYLVYRLIVDEEEEFELLATVGVVRDWKGAIEGELAYTDEAVVLGKSYSYYVIGQAVLGETSEPSNTVTLAVSEESMGDYIVTDEGEAIMTDDGEFIEVTP